MKTQELNQNNFSCEQIIKEEQVTTVESKRAEKEAKPVSFFQLFRFADRTDYIIMAFGTVFSLVNGAAMPMFALLWGNMLNSFSTPSGMIDSTLTMLLEFIYIGLGVFVSGWIMISMWLITGERQAIRCRKEYLASLLKQEIGWFDLVNQAQLSSQFSSDTMSFQGAVGDKIPMVLYVVAMGVSGLIIAFAKGWLLTLVLLAAFPAMIASMYLFMLHVQNKGKRQEASYALAGGRAEQALTAIKTVKMMNGENYQSVNYDQCLEGAKKGAIKYGIMTGVSVGGAFFCMLCCYALGFWYGANCIEATQRCETWISRQDYDAGIVFTCFFSVIIVGMNLSLLPPSLKKITEGRCAAGRIFTIIDRQPRIVNPANGIKIENFKGEIVFHDVHFSYPKDPLRKILNGINLKIRKDKNKIAFVGESGCGKSTLFQLMLRFYDPDQGYITVDGYDLKTIDIKWLREVIGYVGQEPVLFNTTIRQNLLFAKENATEQQLEEALRKAEALDFVNLLEKKMDTEVGLGGGQISGGQKQRIAIARAILKDPKILLLDEATSALDRKNQRLIQNTLNEISKNRTSITIAHRVKTIMNSDDIFVIQKGKLSEQGKFNELKRFEGNDFEEEEAIEKKVVQQEIKQDVKNAPEEAKNANENKQVKQEQIVTKNTIRRVFRYAKGMQLLFIIGLIASGIVGAIYPVFSIFLSSLLQIMLRQKDFIDQASTKALIFFLLGVLDLIACIVQNVCFELIGDQITSKLRSDVFLKMMKLPVWWYEKPENNVGALTTSLAVDCKQVKQMTTTYVYAVVQNITSLIAGIIIGFIYEWRTALVALGLIPFMIGASAIRMAFKTGSSNAEETSKESAGLITEAMTNIRTVVSFGYEEIIKRKYGVILQKLSGLILKTGTVSGFFYGLSQFILFLTIGLIFYLGSLFVYYDGVNIADMFTAVFSLFFAAMTVGNNSHLFPDMAECKASAANLLKILDTKDEDQIQIEEGSKMLKKKINGDFVFKNINFKYATRNDYLFNDFSMKIPFGQKIAFVGTSGCGKSTIMSFLLRFYEPESGTILLDGDNIKDYDIHHLRNQFGVVSQQPVLFNASFRENIIYNIEAKQEEMIAASKKAHAYDFIMDDSSLAIPVANLNVKKNEKDDKKVEQEVVVKKGFDKNVGSKGSHISGGQKQRVAIARAILRKPQILLLDEATSALDSINQKKVQDCLDEIMQNKSSISIAHRLDTIKNSKLIYVFDKGRVAECGNFEELMSKKGYFYSLQKGIQFQ